MAKKLILFPFGGNAREAVMMIEAINRANFEWDLIGFVDDDINLKGRTCCGVRVLGGREILQQSPDAFVLAVAGSPQNYLKRRSIIESLKLEPSRFVQIIHPSVAKSSDVKIGRNVLIMANVVLTTGVVIGDHCIILPNTTISHDAVIGDYSCIGSQVAISGSVEIGENCYIGSGATLRDGIRIGDKTLVGAGSTVVSSVEPGVVVAGSPAKPLAKRV